MEEGQEKLRIYFAKGEEAKRFRAETCPVWAGRSDANKL